MGLLWSSSLINVLHHLPLFFLLREISNLQNRIICYTKGTVGIWKAYLKSFFFIFLAVQKCWCKPPSIRYICVCTFLGCTANLSHWKYLAVKITEFKFLLKCETCHLSLAYMDKVERWPCFYGFLRYLLFKHTAWGNLITNKEKTVKYILNCFVLPHLINQTNPY